MAHHLDPVERVAKCRAARSDARRSAHAEFDPPPTRPDPLSLLAEQLGHTQVLCTLRRNEADRRPLPPGPLCASCTDATPQR